MLAPDGGIDASAPDQTLPMEEEQQSSAPAGGRGAIASEERAAVVLQALARGHLARKRPGPAGPQVATRPQAMMSEERAGVILQALARGYLARKLAAPVAPPLHPVLPPEDAPGPSAPLNAMPAEVANHDQSRPGLTEEEAATHLQSLARGYLTRKRPARRNRPAPSPGSAAPPEAHEEKQSHEPEAGAVGTEQAPAPSAQALMAEADALDMVQGAAKGYLGRKKAQAAGEKRAGGPVSAVAAAEPADGSSTAPPTHDRAPPMVDLSPEDAAVRLQSLARGHLARKAPRPARATEADHVAPAAGAGDTGVGTPPSLPAGESVDGVATAAGAADEGVDGVAAGAGTPPSLPAGEGFAEPEAAAAVGGSGPKPVSSKPSRESSIANLRAMADRRTSTSSKILTQSHGVASSSRALDAQVKDSQETATAPVVPEERLSGEAAGTSTSHNKETGAPMGGESVTVAAGAAAGAGSAASAGHGNDEETTRADFPIPDPPGGDGATESHAPHDAGAGSGAGVSGRLAPVPEGAESGDAQRREAGSHDGDPEVPQHSGTDEAQGSGDKAGTSANDEGGPEGVAAASEEGPGAALTPGASGEQNGGSRATPEAASAKTIPNEGSTPATGSHSPEAGAQAPGGAGRGGAGRGKPGRGGAGKAQAGGGPRKTQSGVGRPGAPSRGPSQGPERRQSLANGMPGAAVERKPSRVAARDPVVAGGSDAGEGQPQGRGSGVKDVKENGEAVDGDATGAARVPGTAQRVRGGAGSRRQVLGKGPSTVGGRGDVNASKAPSRASSKLLRGQGGPRAEAPKGAGAAAEASKPGAADVAGEGRASGSGAAEPGASAEVGSGAPAIAGAVDGDGPGPVDASGAPQDHPEVPGSSTRAAQASSSRPVAMRPSNSLRNRGERNGADGAAAAGEPPGASSESPGRGSLRQASVERLRVARQRRSDGGGNGGGDGGGGDPGVTRPGDSGAAAVGTATAAAPSASLSSGHPALAGIAEETAPGGGRRSSSIYVTPPRHQSVSPDGTRPSRLPLPSVPPSLPPLPGHRADPISPRADDTPRGWSKLSQPTPRAPRAEPGDASRSADRDGAAGPGRARRLDARRQAMGVGSSSHFASALAVPGQQPLRGRALPEDEYRKVVERHRHMREEMDARRHRMEAAYDQRLEQLQAWLVEEEQRRAMAHDALASERQARLERRLWEQQEKRKRRADERERLRRHEQQNPVRAPLYRELERRQEDQRRQVELEFQAALQQRRGVPAVPSGRPMPREPAPGVPRQRVLTGRQAQRAAYEAHVMRVRDGPPQRGAPSARGRPNRDDPDLAVVGEEHDGYSGAGDPAGASGDSPRNRGVGSARPGAPTRGEEAQRLQMRRQYGRLVREHFVPEVDDVRREEIRRRIQLSQEREVFRDLIREMPHPNRVHKAQPEGPHHLRPLHPTMDSDDEELLRTNVQEIQRAIAPKGSSPARREQSAARAPGPPKRTLDPALKRRVESARLGIPAQAAGRSRVPDPRPRAGGVLMQAMQEQTAEGAKRRPAAVVRASLSGWDDGAEEDAPPAADAVADAPGVGGEGSPAAARASQEQHRGAGAAEGARVRENGVDRSAQGGGADGAAGSGGKKRAAGLEDWGVDLRTP